jgi:quinol monooxygenase YgiN
VFSHKIGVNNGYSFAPSSDPEEHAMIISLVKISPSPAKEREALELLNYIVGPTRANPGCLDCSVYHGSEDSSIMFLEKWRDKEDLYEHIKSGLYMSILTAMELSATPPEISVVESMESDGMALIKALRTVQYN